MTSRPSWEEYALLLAATAAKRSEDPYTKVGACVLRKDNSVYGIGYNGAPSGIGIDWADREHRLPRVIHAEANALRYCLPEQCGIMAVTLLPCSSCMTLIASYGIKKVCYNEIYKRDSLALELAEEFGIELKQYAFQGS